MEWYEVDTRAVDGWAATFSTARSGLGGAAARPGPSWLYRMQQLTYQRPVYQSRFDIAHNAQGLKYLKLSTTHREGR